MILFVLSKFSSPVVLVLPTDVVCVVAYAATVVTVLVHLDAVVIKKC